MSALRSFVALSFTTLFSLSASAWDGPVPAKVLYYGGPVISHVKIYAVFWGTQVDPQTVSGIGGFYSAAANSTYLDWLTEYKTNRQDIGRGTYAGAMTITPKNTGTQLDKTDVQAELEHQIDLGALPRPDGDSLFMIHFPAGITLTTGGIASCQSWCGDHEGFASKAYGDIYYAMIPDIGGSCAFGCSFASTPFDSLTVIASHELIEAITDPMCPDIGVNPAPPAAWLAADQNEIGDLCTGSSATLQTKDHTYAVQGEWDNLINGCKAGNFSSP